MLWVILFSVFFVSIPSALAQGSSCAAMANSLPDPQRPAGTEDPRNPIEHMVILMQENHSFDNYFGRLNQKKFYGNEIDGVDASMSNPDSKGKPVQAYHASSICSGDPNHGWDAIHKEWNEGAMNGFVKINGNKTMEYWDDQDLPYYYDLANKFSVADRYFSSALTNTFPNRFYIYSATSFGHTSADIPLTGKQFSQETIFDRLNQYGVTWKYYKDGPGFLLLFQPLYKANRAKIVPLAQLALDMKNGNLPQVAFVDSATLVADEHPLTNIQVGQGFVAQQIENFSRSAYWENSVFFLTYDEGGGYFDHVAPPEACAPDAIEPFLHASSYPGRFDRYGMRVPFLAISPFTKHHYVSHTVFDHTSILKFVETKFNIPALTERDANANGMADLFDFDHPNFEVRPDLALAKKTKKCSIFP